MIGPTVDLLERAAGKIKIVQHEGGRTDTWVPNQEQRTLWDLIVNNPLSFLLKGRQIGATTAVLLFLLLTIALNDRTGNPIRVATVIDVDSKAQERFRVAKTMARRLKIRCKPNEASLILMFPGGSEHVFMSAGSKRAGASGSFHILHLTEMPFWQNVGATMTALGNARVKGGRVIIETTMGVDDLTCRDIWTGDNSYKKLFFTFEEHEEYRCEYDPKVLTADLEARLRRDGFTRRDSMTYWVHLMRDNCGGDYVLCMREYPNTPEASWMMAEGRWVRTSPTVVEPIQSHTVESPSEVGLMWHRYRQPSDGSGHYLVVVDPSGGLERDASPVIVLDRRDRRICASFYSNVAKFDDLATAILDMQMAYCVRLGDGTIARPRVLIESNGVGRGLFQHLERYGVGVEQVHTDKPIRLDAMTLSKRHIEGGVCFGPKELREECESCVLEDGSFEGRKDALMALGLGLRWIGENPLPLETPLPVSDRYVRA